jgi:hypothetical protein
MIAASAEAISRQREEVEAEVKVDVEVEDREDWKLEIGNWKLEIEESRDSGRMIRTLKSDVSDWRRRTTSSINGKCRRISVGREPGRRRRAQFD